MDVLKGIRVVDVTAWAFVPAAGAGSCPLGCGRY